VAFPALYELDLARHAPTDVMGRFAGMAEGPVEAIYPPEVLTGATDYGREIVSGVLDHRAEIDRLIRQRAPTWPLEQMSAVDRNVLRVGLYETLFGGATVPLKAAINEAVELAKLFGSESSAKFVNGVLGRAVESSQGDARPAPGPRQPTAGPASTWGDVPPTHGTPHNPAADRP
jgi:N utilization substance protein B